MRSRERKRTRKKREGRETRGRQRQPDTQASGEADSDGETFGLAEEAGKWDGERFIKGERGGEENCVINFLQTRRLRQYGRRELGTAFSGALNDLDL